MSIPADTPAAVITSPSSTKRASGRTSTFSYLRERLERAPVRRRRAALEQPGGGEDERAGADARHQRPVLAEPADAVEHALVLCLRPGVPAGEDEDVDLADVGPRPVRQEPQAMRAANLVSALGDGVDVDCAAVRLGSPGSEHLVRADDVELFDAVPDRDRNRHPAHSGKYGGFARSPSAEFR